MSDRKLTRSNDRKFLGVCGGLGDYFNRDPAIFRMLWVVISICTGCFPGLIAYLICGAIMENPVN